VTPAAVDAVALARPVRAAVLARAIRWLLQPSDSRGAFQAAAEHAPEASPTGGDRRLSPMRVLIAEDNAVNQMVTQRLLEKQGHTVTIAETGTQTLQIADTAAFDVILMDQEMPGVGGLEATRRLRERGGDVARTPIIALTAAVTDHDRAQCLAAGMDDVVAKPIAPDELLDALERSAATGAGAAAGPGAAPDSDACDQPTAAAADDDPDAVADALDYETVKKLSDIMGSGFGRLRGQFEQSSGQLIERLSAAATDGDQGAMADAAHTLKSSAGSMGGARLHGLCRELEHLAKHGRVDDPVARVERIARERQRLLEALATFEA
jgi:CheY-like chemotaxis protein